MFDPKQYWDKKLKQSFFRAQKEQVSQHDAMAFFRNLFSFPVTVSRRYEGKTTTIAHTRPLKERRMRRAKHAAMMLNARKVAR